MKMKEMVRPGGFDSGKKFVGLRRIRFSGIGRGESGVEAEKRSGQFEQVRHRCMQNQPFKSSLKARSLASASKSAIASLPSVARKVSIRSKMATSASSIFRFS
jgi:hypothetical protein